MNQVKMNILVTGGAGYLGSILVPTLLDAGYRVTVLDNFFFKQAPLNQLCAHPNFDVYRGDVRDEALVTRLSATADIIIPLAALVGAPLCDHDPEGTVGINRDAISLLARSLSSEQRILIPITNSGYGIGEPGKLCDETTPLRPISLYGRTKVEAEKIVLDRGNAISLRLATVFGMAPRMRLDLLVNDFIHRAVKDRALTLFEAHFKRNFIHVRDVARAFIHSIEHFDVMADQAYNVGLSDANLSKAELCARIQKHLPKFTYLEAPFGEDPDKRDYIVSNAKIEGTGFRPAWPLDDGIAELIKGYRMLASGPYANF